MDTEINVDNLVEWIQQHPLAAALALRTNGLVAVFDALTASSAETLLALASATQSKTH